MDLMLLQAGSWLCG